MFHYTYKLESEDGFFYIGSRTCSCDPCDDPYMGSGNWPREKTRNGVLLNKSILSIHADRKTACEQESFLIEQNWNDPKCMNLTKSAPCGGLGFTKNGFKDYLNNLINSELWDLSYESRLMYITALSINHEFGVSLPRLCALAAIPFNEDTVNYATELTKIQIPNQFEFDGKICKIS